MQGLTRVDGYFRAERPFAVRPTPPPTRGRLPARDAIIVPFPSGFFPVFVGYSSRHNAPLWSNRGSDGVAASMPQASALVLTLPWNGRRWSRCTERPTAMHGGRRASSSARAIRRRSSRRSPRFQRPCAAAYSRAYPQLHSRDQPSGSCASWYATATVAARRRAFVCNLADARPVLRSTTIQSIRTSLRF